MCTHVPQAQRPQGKFFQMSGTSISLGLVILELEGLGMVFVLFSPLNTHKLPHLNETTKTERCQKSDSESTEGFVLSQSTTKR